jgi:DNA-binding CsgD family transcriptional regulator
VANEIDDLFAAGNVALAAGDWAGARASFQAGLDREETAEGLAGLADALWWLGEIHVAVDHRERAYAEFRRRPDPVNAALIAVRLCVDYSANFGNVAASAGWLARATRLVEEFRLDPLRGWILLLEAYSGGDPSLGESKAREARELARRSGDLDLELCALSQIGASLVSQGRIEEGVTLLDEAMAGLLGGEGGSRDTVVFTSCHMIASCSHCAEFERAVQWVRAADRFTRRFGCPFLYAFCRTLYGSVLFATGAWEQAEEELRAAVEMSRESLAAIHGQALASLAELRLAQGRIEEAERLVAGFKDHFVAAPVGAGIHLARGEPALASATIQRRLDEVGEDRFESAVLIELLGETEIGRGRQEAAVGRGRALCERGTSLGCQIMVARGERLQGRALSAAGEAEEARPHLETALGAFVRLEMPFEAARTQKLLAEALRGADPEVAVAQGRAALATFEDLGAGRDADAAAALLRELGVKAARAGPKGIGALTKREREVLGLLGEGLSNPEIAERLYVSRKTVEHHVASVLSKLQAKGRAEAAAYAARELGTDPSGK